MVKDTINSRNESEPAYVFAMSNRKDVYSQVISLLKNISPAKRKEKA